MHILVIICIAIALQPLVQLFEVWVATRPTKEQRNTNQMRLFIPPASKPTVRPHLTEAQCIWRNIVVSFLIGLGGIGIYLWIAAHLYGR